MTHCRNITLYYRLITMQRLVKLRTVCLIRQGSRKGLSTQLNRDVPVDLAITD